MATRQKTRLAELSVSDTKLFEKRFDRLKSNFKRFFGNLSNKQMELLRVYSMKTLQDSKIRLNNRAKRQKVFIDFLRNEREFTLIETEIPIFSIQQAQEMFLISPISGFVHISQFRKKKFEVKISNRLRDAFLTYLKNQL